jgi:hypothetical protein
MFREMYFALTLGVPHTTRKQKPRRNPEKKRFSLVNNE